MINEMKIELQLITKRDTQFNKIFKELNIFKCNILFIFRSPNLSRVNIFPN